MLRLGLRLRLRLRVRVKLVPTLRLSMTVFPINKKKETKKSGDGSDATTSVAL
jgi:hypothetical protein